MTDDAFLPVDHLSKDLKCKAMIIVLFQDGLHFMRQY